MPSRRFSSKLYEKPMKERIRSPYGPPKDIDRGPMKPWYGMRQRTIGAVNLVMANPPVITAGLVDWQNEARKQRRSRHGG